MMCPKAALVTLNS